MIPDWRGIAAVLALTAVQAQAGADVEAMLMEELACYDSPDPLPVLEALEAAGRLDRSDMFEMDSITCFGISGRFLLEGFPITGICVHEERSEIRALRPDLLKRGPGTSPGQTLMVTTDASSLAAKTWYQRHFRPSRMNAAIEAGDTFSGAPVEISCTSWMSGGE